LLQKISKKRPSQKRSKDNRMIIDEMKDERKGKGKETTPKLHKNIAQSKIHSPL